MVQPSSTEFNRQNAWADDDIEDLQESSILAFSFKGELTWESQIIIIQIREPERILETFEEELEKLADILLDEDG
jgi:predicted nucleic acid-binding protein